MSTLYLELYKSGIHMCILLDLTNVEWIDSVSTLYKSLRTNPRLCHHLKVISCFLTGIFLPISSYLTLVVVP